MTSPFPGMDPYLESRWRSVHIKLIGDIAEILQPLLPTGLRARPEEDVLFEEDSQDVLGYRPDVAVVETRAIEPSDGGAVAAGATVAEPVVIEFPHEAETARCVEIIDTTGGNRVVTAIEVLSPKNKSAGRDNRKYRRKLRNYHRAKVNVVEIDLLRGSRSNLRIEHHHMPRPRRMPYLACILRGRRLERWECYSIPLRGPIPKIPVPLRRKDDDVLLDLQSLVRRAYAAGGHDDIDYNVDPDPPLSAEDAAWADQLLRAAGRRK